MGIITVGGISLEEFLENEKDEEYKQNIAETLKEISGIKRSFYKPICPAKLPSYFPHSKVRQLSPTEIRKEYGIMQKPYSSLLENILELLYGKDLTGTEIAKSLNLDPQKRSGHISGVLKRAALLCPELIEQKLNRKWSLISPVSTVANFLEIYNGRKGKKKITISSKLEPTQSKTLIENLLENFPQNININVNIKITFGIEK